MFCRLTTPFTWWLLMLAVWNALFLLPLVGPVMHESDQAALLEGSVDLARTGQWFSRDHYNYDKQFGSYAILALAFSVTGSTVTPDQVVATGNWLSLILFNLGLVLLGIRLSSRRAFLLLGCLLLSPSFLAHAPFLAGNYLSAFFLCLQFALLSRPGAVVGPAVCAFLATACRADAVLAQPLLIWATTPASTFAGLLKDKRAWTSLAGCLLALILGMAITSSGADTSSAIAFFFNPKVVAAFVIFGLGASLPIAGLALFAMFSGRKSGASTAFSLVGVAALLLPFAYYVANMYSTRHWTVALVALMAFVASRTGQDLLDNLNPPALARWAVPGIIALATVPLIVGLRLPALNAPSLTLTRPTLVPSADGLIPMGAYLARAWGWDRADRLLPDHNAALWRAALLADLPNEAAQPVQILSSPLVSILRLAVTLRGYRYEISEALPLAEGPPVYADFRAARKAPMNYQHGAEASSLNAASLQHGLELVSPLVQGEGVIRILPEQNAFRRELGLLARSMRGNDFHFHRLTREAGEPDSLPRDLLGRQVAVVAYSPFTLRQGDQTWTAEEKSSPDGKPYFLVVTRTLTDAPVALDAKNAIVAVSVLPCYMSIDAY